MRSDKTKTERVISLLILLLGGAAYTVSDLEQKLQISRRSVFRDIEDLNAMGFEIRNQQGRYRMEPNNARAKHFQKALAGGEYPLSFPEQSRSPLQTEKAVKMTALISATINNRQAIRLLDYHSAKGVSFPRTLEPFLLSANDQTLWAYDTANNDCRQFKILRIGTIEVLETGWQYAHRHQLPFTDIFNLSAAAPIDRIRLRLGDVAYNLIREEHPGSLQFQHPKREREFTIPVADYRGAGRFVLGLMDDVEVLGSAGFKAYLRSVVERYGQF